MPVLLFLCVALLLASRSIERHVERLEWIGDSYGLSDCSWRFGWSGVAGF